MRTIFALLVAVVLASPALATNELLGQPLSKVEEMAKAHGVLVEKLSEADTALMDAGTTRRPKPSDIYLLKLNSSVIIVLVHEGVLIFSSDPVPAEVINKMLNRSGA